MLVHKNKQKQKSDRRWRRMNDTGPDSTSTGLLQTLLFDNEAGADEEARRESEAQSLYVVGGHALAPARSRRRRRRSRHAKTLTLGAE